MSKQELDTVVLTLDDDNELECAILGIFDYNDMQYIALFPQGDNDYAKNGQVFIYRYIKPEDGSPAELAMIQDDEEYENVSEVYDHLMDSLDDEALESSDALE